MGSTSERFTPIESVPILRHTTESSCCVDFEQIFSCTARRLQVTCDMHEHTPLTIGVRTANTIEPAATKKGTAVRCVRRKRGRCNRVWQKMQRLRVREMSKGARARPTGLHGAIELTGGAVRDCVRC